MIYLTVNGAYGRDYETRESVLADWNAEKDFRIRTIGIPGSYINRQQVTPDMQVKIRFNRDRDFVVIRGIEPAVEYTGEVRDDV